MLNLSYIPPASENKELNHEQRKKMFAELRSLLNALKLTTREERLAHCRKFFPDKKIESSNDLNYYEMTQYISYIMQEKQKLKKELATGTSTQTTNIFERDQFFGRVKRIFFSKDNYNVFIFDIEETHHEITVQCSGYAIKLQEEFTIKGEWIHSKYGKQFKVNSIPQKETYNIQNALSKEGIIEFLKTLPGVGSKKAENIYNAFGDKTFEIIEKTPEKLKEMNLNENQIKLISDSYQEQKAKKDMYCFLFGMGLTHNQVDKVIEYYEDNDYTEDLITNIKKNPYILIQISGFGFLKADKIAIMNGYDLNGYERITNCCEYVFNNLAELGNTAVSKVKLIKEINSLIGVNENRIEEIIDIDIASSKLKVEYDKINNISLIQTFDYFVKEAWIAQRLIKLSKDSVFFYNDYVDYVHYAERRLGIDFSNSQREALINTLKSNVSIITGGAGTGKTTLLKGILQCLNKERIDYILLAPTGKAAKRISESTGEEAHTIHKAILHEMLVDSEKIIEGLKVVTKGKQCIIIDEASMVNNNLLHWLLENTEDKIKLIIIGDINQLPSIGAGNILADLILSNYFETTYLTEIQRQSEASNIITASNTISNGFVPDFKNDCLKFTTKTTEESVKKAIWLLDDLLKTNNIDDIMILSPMKKGDTGVDACNIGIQNKFNPNSQDETKHIKFYNDKYCLGDRVIHIKNNYDKRVFNGEIGYITSIDHFNKTLLVDYDDKQIQYDSKDISELKLAYAITIHKSQGSEYKVIIILLDKANYIMLNKKLLYTAITRGKKQVYIISQEKCIQYAVNSTRIENRITLLRDKLDYYANKYGNTLISTDLNHQDNDEEDDDLESIPDEIEF